MATNSNNLEQEFDALLKTHVKQRAQIAACAQFDPDDATAYLEQALSKAAHAMFEEHIASCVHCRRHLIELSRLLPATVHTAEPLVAQSTLQERLVEWFSGWRLGALAGLGAVTATVLFVAVLMNRNPSENASPMIAARQSELQPSPLPEPTSTATFSDTPANEETATVSSPPAATASVGVGKGTANNVPVAPPAKAAPSQPGTTSDSAPPPPPVPVPTPPPNKSEAERKESTASPTAGASASQNQIGNLRAQTPSGPASNQMQAERAFELRKRNEPAAPSNDSLASTAVKPASKSAEPTPEREDNKRKAAVAYESAKKQAPPRPAAVREKVIERDRPARPVRAIAGKTFQQENGVWIDNDYNPGSNLPVVRLIRDSDAYKQTLKDFPGLKPYFDLHPVVVVWQGIAYRVETR